MGGGGGATGGGGGATGGTCASPTPLTFGADGVTVSAATAGTTALTGTCGGSGSPELVYSFTQATTGPFLATVAPSLSSGNLRPVIYVRSACTTMTDEACTGMSQNQARSLSIASLPAGAWYLVIDGTGPGGSAGPFTMTAFQGPQPGESCSASPRVVNLATATSVTFAGDTTGLVGDRTVSCGGTGGPDIIYEVTAPRAGTMTVTTRGTFDIALGVFSGAAMCAAATELDCSDSDLGGDGSSESTSGPVTAGTTYWFWVTGYDDVDQGQYQITFALP